MLPQKYGLFDGVYTSTMSCRLFPNIIASLAAYQREVIRDRTNTGLQSARVGRRAGGRPKGFFTVIRKKINSIVNYKIVIYKNLAL